MLSAATDDRQPFLAQTRRPGAEEVDAWGLDVGVSSAQASGCAV